MAPPSPGWHVRLFASRSGFIQGDPWAGSGGVGSQTGSPCCHPIHLRVSLRSTGEIQGRCEPTRLPSGLICPLIHLLSKQSLAFPEASPGTGSSLPINTLSLSLGQRHLCNWHQHLPPSAPPCPARSLATPSAPPERALQRLRLASGCPPRELSEPRASATTEPWLVPELHCPRCGEESRAQRSEVSCSGSHGSGPGLAKEEPRRVCRGQPAELTGVCRHVPRGRECAPPPSFTPCLRIPVRGACEATRVAGVEANLAPQRAWVGSSLTLPSSLYG